MKQEPQVSQFLDQEEQSLIALIESDQHQPSKSILTPEMMTEMQKLAKNTLHDSTEKVSIRIARNDIARARAQALRAGIPYQTYLKSLIHQGLQKQHILYDSVSK